MSGRKEPFPSTIEGCENLLQSVQYTWRFSYGPVATHVIGDVYRPPDDMILPPFHPTSHFMAQGALIGAYGGLRMTRRTVLDVECLSNPKNLDNPDDLMYRVSWPWAKRFGLRAMNASWFVEPRGEGYSYKHIAAMALFRTYTSQLGGQREAQEAWRLRDNAAYDFLKARDPEQEHREMLEKFDQSRTRALSSSARAPSDDERVFLGYAPKKEFVPAEPTNEELDIPPVNQQYEQPPTPTS